MKTPMTVMERLQGAMNDHDLEGMIACFDPGYESEQPAHPNRGFGGADQVRKNWSALFSGIPDLHADLLGATSSGEEAWTRVALVRDAPGRLTH
ncbi:MAG: nuclear transport factor 2 family protein [Nocardioidaceae bacterium]